MIVDLIVFILIIYGVLKVVGLGNERESGLTKFVNGVFIILFAYYAIPYLLGLEILGVNDGDFLMKSDSVEVVVPKEDKDMIISGDYDIDELDSKYGGFLIKRVHINKEDAFIVRLEDKHDKSSYTIISE